jgi:hypothetical protein
MTAEKGFENKTIKLALRHAGVTPADSDVYATDIYCTVHAVLVLVFAKATNEYAGPVPGAWMPFKRPKTTESDYDGAGICHKGSDGQTVSTKAPKILSTRPFNRLPILNMTLFLPQQSTLLRGDGVKRCGGKTTVPVLVL